LKNGFCFANAGSLWKKLSEAVRAVIEVSRGTEWMRTRTNFVSSRLSFQERAMMRILHFMNIPLSIDEIRSEGKGINTSGGWMAALLGLMLKSTDHSFACVAFGRTKKVLESHDDRIDCFVVPGDIIGNSMDKTLYACRELVGQWKPDLIHIHGTEALYGLLTARGMVEVPSVISLQGLIGPYSEWYHFFGNSRFMDIVRMHRWRDIPAMRGPLGGFRSMQKMAKREREIITGNKFFMGRTGWDRAYVTALNPGARYHHGGELLREAFWQKRWNIAQARRHRIVFTNASHPRKGTETLLGAIKLLQPLFPDIQVAIAGDISRRSGYGKYLHKRISELGHAVIVLGPLSAEKMVEELANSHVFVSPSFIDNSPNAVCEAQLLGMPVISTYTGGVPSLIEDGRTGLFFPTGDAPMLAAKLRGLFEDDSLAVRLGRQAREVSMERHDPDTVVRGILAVYDDIVKNVH
jgi:glycosyltransferase involved in cell wall biosynthesis